MMKHFLLFKIEIRPYFSQFCFNNSNLFNFIYVNFLIIKFSLDSKVPCVYQPFNKVFCVENKSLIYQFLRIVFNTRFLGYQQRNSFGTYFVQFSRLKKKQIETPNQLLNMSPKNYSMTSLHTCSRHFGKIFLQP